jgi:hypothetical protein
MPGQSKDAPPLILLFNDEYRAQAVENGRKLLEFLG